MKSVTEEAFAPVGMTAGCFNCYYGRFVGNYAEGECGHKDATLFNHECRRHAPAFSEECTGWPAVMGTDWCGDWERDYSR